ncbi:hypothetical protein E2C01_072691 [Portunus trituberculatus]|uniref:Uncharacterized protein n=1 Tax=Portunus trituberculatus TaxID=210409 RepID=A0A5B7I8I8_PORTR|nr:hypothetical protein [Portunus trituberculatus]
MSRATVPSYAVLLTRARLASVRSGHYKYIQHPSTKLLWVQFSDLPHIRDRCEKLNSLIYCQSLHDTTHTCRRRIPDKAEDLKLLGTLYNVERNAQNRFTFDHNCIHYLNYFKVHLLHFFFFYSDNFAYIFVFIPVVR